MTESDLKFCEDFENRTKELQLLDAMKDELTQKGMDLYASRKRWLNNNIDKYLRLNG